MRYFVASALLLTASSHVFSQPIKINEVYGIKIGSKSPTLSYTSEKYSNGKGPIPGTMWKEVNFEKSGLSKPAPLLRDEKAWGFVVLDTSSEAVIGVGIATTTAYASIGREMRAAIESKCSNASEFSVKPYQGVEPFGRPRLGEMEGQNEDGLIMTFTDRQIGSSVVNLMRLTYIDPVLARKATNKSVEASGF